MTVKDIEATVPYPCEGCNRNSRVDESHCPLYCSCRPYREWLHEVWTGIRERLRDENRSD